MEQKIIEKAKELRREYYREYRKKNPEKIRKHQEDYWARKAKAALKAERQ
ncbi:MAG: phosphatase [Firmicutes bacterium]|nr:phosphatase [Bacillota bacterium]